MTTCRTGRSRPSRPSRRSWPDAGAPDVGCGDATVRVDQHPLAVGRKVADRRVPVDEEDPGASARGPVDACAVQAVVDSGADGRRTSACDQHRERTDDEHRLHRCKSVLPEESESQRRTKIARKDTAVGVVLSEHDRRAAVSFHGRDYVEPSTLPSAGIRRYGALVKRRRGMPIYLMTREAEWLRKRNQDPTVLFIGRGDGSFVVYGLSGGSLASRVFSRLTRASRVMGGRRSVITPERPVCLAWRPDDDVQCSGG